MSRFFKSAAFPILIVVVLAFFAQKLISPGTRTHVPNYSEFVGDVQKGQIKDVTGDKLDERFLAAVTPKALVIRMLNNLMRIAQDERDLDGSLRYLDMLIALDPEGTGRDRS